MKIKRLSKYLVLWPPHAKSWLIGKDSDAGRDWGQEENGTTEDEMAGWHHWLNGLESEWTPGVGDGQGGLACCDSWGRKELDTTEWLNNSKTNLLVHDNLNRQSMFDAGYRMLGAGARGWSREMIWGGRWEGGSCLGTHVRIKDFKI